MRAIDEVLLLCAIDCDVHGDTRGLHSICYFCKERVEVAVRVVLVVLVMSLTLEVRCAAAAALSLFRLLC